VEALRDEVAKAQQAVRSEQELAERLRREAAAASANAQRQACPVTGLRGSSCLITTAYKTLLAVVQHRWRCWGRRKRLFRGDARTSRCS
jgi:hypothetical protein